MGEGFGQGRLVTQHLWQIVGQRGFNRRAAIGAESSARDLDRFLYWSTDINRLEYQLRRMRKVVDLRDDLIKAIDFLDHDIVEIFAEIGVVESLGKKLRESFYRDQRVADFVGHAGGEVGPEGRSIDQGLFLMQGFLGRQILDDRDSAKRRALIAKPSRFD